MAGGEACQSYAADGLFGGKVHGGYWLWVDYCYGIDSACGDDGRRVANSTRVGEDVWHQPRWVDLVCEYGLSTGVAGSCECGTGYCESDLPADVVYEWALDADSISAALAAANCACSADVPSGAVDVAHLWICE